ncbi:SIR2 family protein [Calidifontibacter terrae]
MYFGHVFVAHADSADLLHDRLVPLAAADELAAQLEALPHDLPSVRRIPLIAVPAPTDADEIDEATTDRLLEVLEEHARRRNVDIALITPDLRGYHAVQARRLIRAAALFPGFPASAAPGAISRAECEHLGRLVRQGNLSLFLGAEITTTLGRPGWAELLRTLAKDKSVTELGIAADQIAALDPSAAAKLLRRSMPHLADRIVDLVGKDDKPGLGHVLAAALGARQVITSTYDLRYERAVRSAGGRRISVLPYERADDGAWLLKRHGDVAHRDDIVLARARTAPGGDRFRPDAALFQALLTTSHALIVGPSAQDDDLLRLVDGVESFLRRSGEDTRCGTVLAVHDDPARARLVEGRLDWITLSGEDVHERARTLEIVLDAIGMFACDDSDVSLDEKHEANLAAEDRAIARDLRAIAGRIARTGNRTWDGITGALGRYQDDE